MAGNYPSVTDTTGPLDVSRVFVLSGVARLGKPGLAWVRRMDESPIPNENEEPGALQGRILPSRFKNGLPGASSGTRLEMLLALA
jgi:hypothetical protein